METLITEMSAAQRAALDIYLDVDHDYAPPSFSVISERLTQAGFTASKSTVQRWSKEFKFETHLNRHVNALVLSDKDDYERLEKEAGAENLKKTLMTLEENAELLHGSHGVLKLLVSQISVKAKANKPITDKDAKLMLQLYSITSAREDRLHDRQAGLDAVDKITKAELLKQFAGTNINLEKMADDEVTDVEVEE